MKSLQFRSFFLFFIFSIIAATISSVAFYMQQERSNRENIKHSFLTSAIQLSDTIAFNLKVLDLPSIERATNKSFMAQNASSYQITDTGNYVIYKNHTSRACLPEYKNKIPITYTGETVGHIEYCYAVNSDTNSRWLFISFLVFFAVISLFGIFCFYFFSTILKQINVFLKSIDDVDINNPCINPPKNVRNNTLINLYEKINSLISKINSLALENKKKQEDSIIASLSSQVAHDIRSPLAALNSVVAEINDIPEAQRLLIRRATERINDIANNLLTSNKKVRAQVNSQIKEQSNDIHLQNILLVRIIEDIISEKRQCFRTKINMEINFEVNQNNYNIFVNINSTEFKSMISNLINNAIESFHNGHGIVEVKLSKNNDTAIIEITDNGKGIPKHIISKLGTQSFSYNKKNGNGLGLFHAYNLMSTINGQIIIDSQENIGTAIKLIIPLAPNPDWFTDRLILNDISHIIILDDDPSIHQIWDNRLSQIIKKTKSNIKIHHFVDPQEIELYFTSNAYSATEKKLFLIDYEFIGSHTNGIELINKLKINNQSVLVTSHFENTEIVKKCQNNGIKILPKNISFCVDIFLNLSSQHLQSILIDDDDLTQFNWKNIAKKKGVNLKIYSSTQEFFQDAKNINKSASIYIDSSLGDGIKGEIVSEEIYNLGFQDITLTTGYDQELINKPHWIKNIIDKTPPW